jgi:hypothetical protein
MIFFTFLLLLTVGCAQCRRALAFAGWLSAALAHIRCYPIFLYFVDDEYFINLL